MFNDKAIINLPNPFRYLLAKLISFTRNGKATKIYEQLGGGSPILPLTYDQASALERALTTEGDYKVFTYMRYSYPGIDDVIAKVKAYNPEQIVLLPLYPQYSTTTSASSISQWHQEGEKHAIAAKTHSILSYEDNDDFAAAYADLLVIEYRRAAEHAKDKEAEVILLFSAHGIPLNRIEAGDPYQLHVEKSVVAIMQKANLPKLEYKICYQSKVGPLKWLEPSAEVMVEKYAIEKRVLIVLPVAFVSEHSETLVELDIQYRELALEKGAKGYFRVPAVGTHPKFIDCLKGLVLSVKELGS